MVLFYGMDNFLINQAVENYCNNNLLSQDALVTYYLETESLAITIEKILTEISSSDLFDSKKVVVICDYFLVLNNNHQALEELIIKMKQFANNNIIIFKVLASHLNQEILNAKIDIIHVKPYNKEQIRNWVLEKNKQYKIQFAAQAFGAFLDKIPNSLTIIDNELQKLHMLNQVVDVEKVENITSNYFSYNPFQLINFWLTENYVSFWLQYRSYWEKINYDKLNLFSIVTYQLELIRNIKLLLKNNLSYQAIMAKLNISVFQLKSLLQCKLAVTEINQLLIRAHELDFYLKSGKIAKNLAIDLFFCKI